MTIAACYLCPEGLVLGADSTSSAQISAGPGLAGFHFYNHNQKLFEVGENSTLGIVTWGAGSLGPKSHREVIAQLADDIAKNTAKSVGDVADRFAKLVWNEYQSAYAPLIQKCKDLAAKGPHDVALPVAPGVPRRTDIEQREFDALVLNLPLGFCIGGYMPPDRATTAFELLCDPLATALTPKQMPALSYKFWGVPRLVQRLIQGADDVLKDAILKSGKWTGTEAELVTVLEAQRIGSPCLLPIRDAIDFVHTCIYTTIKAMKFSSFFQVCGGPIELAVITADRRFRWVKHKPWDSALDEG
jgi:hypothetical protein